MKLLKYIIFLPLLFFPCFLISQFEYFTIITNTQTYPNSHHLTLSNHNFAFHQYNKRQFIPCISVQKIIDNNDLIVEFDCVENEIFYNENEIFYNEPVIENPVDMDNIRYDMSKPFTMAGGIFIILSGLNNYLIINSDCPDCNSEEWQKYYDSIEKSTERSAIFLILGGALIIIGEIIED